MRDENIRKQDIVIDDMPMDLILMGFGDTTLVENEDTDAPTLEGIEDILQRAVCVRLDGYGTRTTTVVSYDAGMGFDFVEKNYATPFQQLSTSHELIPLRLKERTPVCDG